ncbi:MAG: radical SAM protein [Promethearchaeota archaeon]
MRVIDCVHLGVTGSCNFHCEYCCAAEEQCLDYQEFTIPEFEQFVIPALQELRPNAVVLEGGEPLYKWDRLLKTIEIIKDNVDSVEAFQLLTNGSLLTEKRLKKLLEMTERSLDVIISFDTYNKEKDVRNPNAHHAVKNAIELCKQYEVLSVISAVVTKQNFNDLENLLEKYKNTGILICCSPSIPHIPEHNKFALTPQQLVKLDTILLENLLNPAYMPSPLPIEPNTWEQLEPLLEEAHLRQYLGCTALKYDICIRPNGSIKPCQVWNLEIGNLRTETIKEILDSPVAQKIVNYKNHEGKCAKCKYRRSCLGGCRARAYMETGNVYGDIPSCEVGPNGHPLEEIATQKFLEAIEYFAMKFSD